MGFYGDFLGFTFNGTHSSSLNIYRVSDGSRYNINLLPEFTDKTAIVPGKDGTYYWKTNYTKRQLPINIAFDNVTEADLRNIRRLFSANKAGDLVFDEAPYKSYMAKLSGAPQLKIISFTENGQNIYKGEGTLNFVCYDPFAFCSHKYLNDSYYNEYINKDLWRSGSGQLDTNEIPGTPLDIYTGTPTNGIIKLYNPGDLDTNLKLTLSFDGVIESANPLAIKIQLFDPQQSSTTYLNEIDLKITEQLSTEDTQITIDSETHLITSDKGYLYNKFIIAGDFFQLPISSHNEHYYQMYISGQNFNTPTIEYNYLYY